MRRAELVGEDLLDRLRRSACAAEAFQYERYSGFGVTAAVETLDGYVHGGANIEVVNYSLTKHAEEVAIICALAAGAVDRCGDSWLRALYVQGAAPCGSCRQFAWEWSSPETVCVVDRAGNDWEARLLAELIPEPFDPGVLPDRRRRPPSTAGP